MSKPINTAYHGSSSSDIQFNFASAPREEEQPVGQVKPKAISKFAQRSVSKSWFASFINPQPCRTEDTADATDYSNTKGVGKIAPTTLHWSGSASSSGGASSSKRSKRYNDPARHSHKDWIGLVRKTFRGAVERHREHYDDLIAAEKRKPSYEDVKGDLEMESENKNQSRTNQNRGQNRRKTTDDLCQSDDRSSSNLDMPLAHDRKPILRRGRVIRRAGGNNDTGEKAAALSQWLHESNDGDATMANQTPPSVPILKGQSLRSEESILRFSENLPNTDDQSVKNNNNPTSENHSAKMNSSTSFHALHRGTSGLRRENGAYHGTNQSREPTHVPMVARTTSRSLIEDESTVMPDIGRSFELNRSDSLRCHRQSTPSNRGPSIVSSPFPDDEGSMGRVNGQDPTTTQLFPQLTTCIDCRLDHYPPPYEGMVTDKDESRYYHCPRCIERIFVDCGPFHPPLHLSLDRLFSDIRQEPTTAKETTTVRRNRTTPSTKTRQRRKSSRGRIRSSSPPEGKPKGSVDTLADGRRQEPRRRRKSTKDNTQKKKRERTTSPSRRRQPNETRKSTSVCDTRSMSSRARKVLTERNNSQRHVDVAQVAPTSVYRSHSKPLLVSASLSGQMVVDRQKTMDPCPRIDSIPDPKRNLKSTNAPHRPNSSIFTNTKGRRRKSSKADDRIPMARNIKPNHT